MEKHFLDDFVHKIDPSAKLGSHKDAREPWYNQNGDCIEFQTINEAIIADRIDEFLTIYRSAKNEEPIGFQLKDVLALVKKYGVDSLAIEAKVKSGRLMSVTTLLLSAYESLPQTINRRLSYSSALNAIPKEGDRVNLLEV